jgi:hypothetical protein
MASVFGVVWCRGGMCGGGMIVRLQRTIEYYIFYFVIVRS